MEKKESYVVINGVRYDAVKNEFERCFGCAFKHGLECSRNRADGFFVTCYSGFVFKCRGDVAAQQRLTERSEKETVEDGKAKKPGIGKRSYYAFPNGVEAEDICRYLSFNLGNVVKYVCRSGRKDPTKKIEDLEKARDYLEDEIKRAKEELDNEIEGMKEKIAKENEGR